MKNHRHCDNSRTKPYQVIEKSFARAFFSLLSDITNA